MKFVLLFIALASCALTSLNITAYSSNQNSLVSWFKSSDNKYYVFLPKSADARLKVDFFADAASLKLSKGDVVETIANGGETSLFAEDGIVNANIDGQDYQLNVMRSDDGLDAMFLQTPLKSMAYINAKKGNKEKGVLNINGDASISVSQIKGRGNTTWQAKKKPYNVKLGNKLDMFGFGATNKWCYIANAFDPTLIRNGVAYNLGHKMNFKFTPECHPIDFYANGDYAGAYNWCEKIEIGEERVNINNLANDDAESAPQVGTGPDGAVEKGEVKGSRKWVDFHENPADITGGYLLEFDISGRYDEEVSGFSSKMGQTVVFKEPEFATKEEVNYMADKYQDIEDAIYSKTGFNAKGQHYSELIDVPSFVEVYIHHEFTMCEDSGLTSTYFHKDLDSVQGNSKLFAGPIWDFDNSMINDNVRYRYGFDMTDSQIWWVNAVFYGKSLGEGTVNEFPTIFTALYKHDDFRRAVAKRWKELVAANVFTELKEEAITLRNSIRKSAVMNGIRWDELGDNKEEKFEEVSDAVINYIDERVAILNKGFAENSAMLYYDSNGANGFVFNDKIVSIGESIKLKGADVEESELTYPGKVFKYWTENPEGKGKKYYAGDYYRLTRRTNTLYAQWGEDSSNLKWIIIIASIAGVILIAGIVAVIVFLL